MKRSLTLLLFFCLTIFLLSQNNGIVTGKIVDQTSKEALAGVIIKQKGTNNGVISDIRGEFNIPLIKGSEFLEISFLGYETLEIKASTSETLNIEMQEKNMELDQVVVTGYTTQRKINLTGAVDAVSGKTLASKPVINASMALQGVAPGVTVTQSSGRPGGDGGVIRIRGIGTLNDANPLILVDGRQGNIDGLDVNDIENISILKDAASAAIYGSRAANGVILITTKRGKLGKISVNYSGYIGKQDYTERPQYVDGYTHMKLNNVAVANTGRTPVFSEEYMAKYLENRGLYSYEYPDVNWQDVMYTGSGLQQHHHISISGGNETLSTMASLSIMDQRGIVENFNIKRYSARINNDLTVNKWLKFKFDMGVRFTPMDQPTVGVTQVFNLQRYSPLFAVYLPDGRFAVNSSNYPNLKASVSEGGVNKVDYISLIGTLSAILNPVKGLNITVNYMPDYNQSKGKSFLKPIPLYRPDSEEPALYSPTMSTLNESFSKNMTNSFNLIGSYNLTIKKHNASVLLGYEQIDYTSDYFNAYRENFPFVDYPVLDAGDKINMRNGGSGEEWALRSFFGRINYNYDNRYLFEANIRKDGSSRFIEKNRYGVFPSFSIGWNLREEQFLRDVTWLDQVKLRGSWGKLGNQNIGNYPFASVFSISGVDYVLNGEPVKGMALGNMANESITWETTTSTNFGLDFAVLGKISGSFDIFKKITDDILIQLPIPKVIGLNAPYQNAGKVENKGWELSLNYRDKLGNLSYGIKTSISDVKNKVLDLKGAGPFISRFTIIQEGMPINALYMLNSDGLFQNEDEISSHATQYGSLQPGDIRYIDQLTVDTDNDRISDIGDGKINASDRVVVGSNIPRYTYAIDLSAEYKGFDFSVLLQGVGKRDTYLDGSNVFAFYNVGQMQKWHLDYWTPENTNAKYPRLIDGSTHNNFEISDYWKFNAAYLRVKNINIGYTIPVVLSKKFGVDKLRVYFSGSNLFTFDHLPDGFDPEYPMGNEFTYPITSNYVFGVNVSF